MRTDDLIHSLAAQTRPVAPKWLESRLAFALAIGAAASLLLVLAALGLRPDLGRAVLGFSFWMKLIYTASIAAVAIHSTAVLARPDGDRLRMPWLLAIPFAALGAIALAELLNAPRSHWLAMWLGDSWKVCSVLVFALSLPLLTALVWAFRRFAPTRLRAAGVAIGLTSGGLAATAYCLHCPEVSALFVLTWYTLGIALAGLAGGILGPKVLRW